MLSKDLLHNYQLNAERHIIDNPSAGLFMEMGLGKTVSTLTAIEYLIYGLLEVQKVLVIAPKRVVESVWTAEIENWEHIKHLQAVRVIGTPKQRRKALEKDVDIYLISRDNIAWLIGEYGGLQLPFDMLVIDESSSFKNHKSVRFKALKRVIGSFDRRVILTGTPAPNNLLDLWPQIYVLDQGQRLGKFITHYRKNYFSKGEGLYGKYTPTEYGEKRIQERIGDICLSMKSEDYLDLPERIDNYVEIKFDDTLRNKYRSFEREQILEFAEPQTEVTAFNAAALCTKLLQFANGTMYGNDKEVLEVHKLKLDAAQDIVEEAQGKPVLIAWTYRHDRDRLLKRLAKYKPVELKGQKEITAWNKGEIRVMLMHPASGGHGLNLQKGGNIIIWFGQTWSLELYQQFNARLHRQGQSRSVIVHHLIAKGTMDVDVMRAQRRKKEGQEALMQAVKMRMKQYKI